MLDISYTSTIGSIQYVVPCTEPDVAFALTVISRYQVCGVVEKLTLEGYSNASFQFDGDDSKSQLGFVFRLHGGMVV
ncbi:UNVERIFIED_CONTAM: hypothetical protein Slati_4474700 [Sesamum latifolium]|uniref:Uncharacterized protein n=1 Tax=Sesamum latifolium TaxID=2727402 RepID=A0AAW2SSG0_9LAMI